MAKYIVKAINNYSANATNNSNNIYLPQGYFRDIEDCAFFSNVAYQRIFGKKKASSNIRHKRLSVVKITFGGYKIYRQYYYENSISGLHSSEVGLTPASIRFLALYSNNNVVGKEVEVIKGHWFSYYWHHPFHATRISCRLGVWSIIISLTAFIISLLQCF